MGSAGMGNGVFGRGSVKREGVSASWVSVPFGVRMFWNWKEVGAAQPWDSTKCHQMRHRNRAEFMGCGLPQWDREAGPRPPRPRGSEDTLGVLSHPAESRAVFSAPPGLGYGVSVSPDGNAAQGDRGPVSPWAVRVGPCARAMDPSPHYHPRPVQPARARAQEAGGSGAVRLRPFPAVRSLCAPASLCLPTCDGPMVSSW